MTILNTAHSFYLASKRCLEMRETGKNSFEMLMLPAIVNLSFAAELYLKYLIEQKGEKVKGHNLKKLFNNLEEEHKICIISIFDKIQNNKQDRMKKVPSNVAEKLNIKKHLDLIEKNFYKDFDALIDQQADSFVDWRYLHENENFRHINLNLLFSICDGAREVISGKKE